MDASDKNTITSNPIRTVADRPMATQVFSGTVIAVKEEKGQQTVEVQYAQGRLKVIAEGTFQAGDKVRITFPGDYTVQVSKSSHGEGQPTVPVQSSGYILPPTLLDVMDAKPLEPGAKPILQDIFKPQGRGSVLANLPIFTTGSGATTWFGQLIEKSRVDSEGSELHRLQYGERGTTVKTDSQFRYQVEVQGSRIDVFSPQSKEAGDLTEFSVESRGGRIHAKFLDPIESIPAALRADFSKASQALRQAMQVSVQYLEEFKHEPYHEKLVKDFSQILDQSGLMKQGPHSSKPVLPDQKALDGLMRLFLAFPRDTQASGNLKNGEQAKTWGDAVKNPEAMQGLLKALKPLQDSTLLRSNTRLHLAQIVQTLNLSSAAATPATEALMGWLKKNLPEGFTPNDLRKLAEVSVNAFANLGKEEDPAKFILQSMAPNFPREEELRPGKPGEFYFYQGQDWHGLKVTWQKGEQGDGKGKKGSREPIKFHVETQAKMLGKVDVAITMEPFGHGDGYGKSHGKGYGMGKGVDSGARIDFKNQFHDVRELFTSALPELEKNLEYMDFKVASWSYSLLQEDSPLPVQNRLPVQNQNANLDLFG